MDKGNSVESIMSRWDCLHRINLISYIKIITALIIYTIKDLTQPESWR